jgi:hypothetical protein
VGVGISGLGGAGGALAGGTSTNAGGLPGFMAGVADTPGNERKHITNRKQAQRIFIECAIFDQRNVQSACQMKGRREVASR